MRFYHDQSPAKCGAWDAVRGVKVPPMFCQTDPLTGQLVQKYMPADEDCLTVSLVGIGFWTINKRSKDGKTPGYCDLPDDLGPRAIASLGPKLITEVAAKARGLI